MVNAFTGGFRAAQAKLAINKVLAGAVAAAALESAQVVALAILVREQLDGAAFGLMYRPFATLVPGPGHVPPQAPDQQVAALARLLPALGDTARAEAVAIGKAMSEPLPETAPAAPPPPIIPGLPPPPSNEVMDVPSLYAAGWKAVIAKAAETNRTAGFRAAQELAENAAPHDGTGLVGLAGVSAGSVYMREHLPIELVLLMHEPLAAAIPYESLR